MKILNGILHLDQYSLNHEGVPHDFFCPISKSIFQHPVATSAGTIYEKTYIESEIEYKARLHLPLKDLVTQVEITTELIDMPQVIDIIHEWSKHHNRKDILDLIPHTMPPKKHETKIQVRTADEALEIIYSENALVRMIDSNARNDIHWDFNIKQYRDPAHVRPVKNFRNMPIDRTKVYDPKNKQWIQRQIHDQRGHDQEGVEFTKKMSTTLLPADGKMYLYITNKHSVGLIYDLNKCDTLNEKYIFLRNANTNKRWWIHNNLGNNTLINSVSIKVIRHYNKRNRLKGVIPKHNELLVLVSLNAIIGIFSPRDHITSRLNALSRKFYVRDNLHIDIPLFIITPDRGTQVYTENQQIDDLVFALQSDDPISRYFSQVSLPYFDIEKIWNTLTSKIRGKIIYYLIYDKQFNLSSKCLLFSADITLDWHDAITKNSALHYAVIAKQEELVKLLCQQGANPNIKNSKDRSAIDIAIYNKYYTLLQIMIENAENNIPILTKNYILLFILNNKKYSFGYYLLSHFTFSVNCYFQHTKMTLFHYGVLSGDASFVTLLCNKKANPFLKNNNEATPLHIALKKNRLDLIDIILKNTTYPIPEDQGGHLLLYLMMYKYYDLAQTLIAFFPTIPIDFTCKKSGKAALHYAVTASHYPLATLLCARGADPGSLNVHIDSPLALAVKNQDDDMIMLLIKKSTLISNYGTISHANLLISLICNENVDLAEMLISKSTFRYYILKSSDSNNNNALHHAILSNKRSHHLIKMMCINGIDAGQINKDGETPISYAIQRNDWKSLQYILRYAVKSITKELSEVIISTLIQHSKLELNIILKLHNHTDINIEIISEMFRQILQAAKSEDEVRNLWDELSLLRNHHPKTLHYFYRRPRLIDSLFRITNNESQLWKNLHALTKKRILFLSYEQNQADTIFHHSNESAISFRIRWPRFFQTRSPSPSHSSPLLHQHPILQKKC